MANRIDVSAVLDKQGWSSFRILLLAMIAAAAFLEGFDSQLQGYTAPAIIKLWHLSRPQYSVVFVWFQLGFMLGAFTLGNLGDIIGRRLTIALGVLLFGVFTVAGALSGDLLTLNVTRFLSAIFLGSAIPNSIALTIDYAPHDQRALNVGYMFVAYTAGSSAGGMFAAWLVPAYGWQSIYWLCGLLSLALGLVLYGWLPESLRFMVVRHRHRYRVAAVVRRLAPTAMITAETQFFMPRSVETRAWVGELFRERRAVMTMAMWASYSFSMMALIFVTSWMPTIYADAGMSYSASVIATALFQGGGMIGSILGGRVLDSRWSILGAAGVCLCGVPIIIGIGHSVAVPALLMALTFGAGACVVATHTVLNTLSGALYPTALRSTGAGWASGFGRIGAIIGPVLGGVLISLHLSLPMVFLIVSGPSACITLSLLIIKFTRPRERAPSTVGLDQPRRASAG
ncbi:MAG TPA: MFS transporter [Stellaceae bacterium]|jgi:AAHS family 4-hydroxybenzoate transporter-like MFS transporter|nr:MFS transporter [Stellaceae bacterium]